MIDKSLVPSNFQDLSADERKEIALVQMWLKSKSKTTQYNYRKVYSLLKESFPKVSIWSLSTIHVSAFFTKHSVAVSNRSMATYRSTLSSLMDFLIRMRMRVDNPVLNTDHYRFTESLRSKVIDKGDILKMVSELSGRNRALIKFLYLTGVRVSELTAIKWSGIYFETEKVRIEVLGKGGKARSVFLKHEVFRDIASDLLGDLGADSKKIVLSGKNRERFLFETKYGTGMTRRAVYKAVAKDSERILGRAISPHKYRHSNASHALRSGAPINVVQRTLGHSDLNTTAKYLGTTSDESTADFLDLSVES